MTTAATIPMPPMVGVPALAMWTWGPSSRICWPMLFLISQRMSTGVDRTATHRATPPDVMSEITPGYPRNGPRGPGRASARSSNGTDRPPAVWVVSWPLPASRTTIAGLRPSDGQADGLGPVGLDHHLGTSTAVRPGSPR